MKIPAYSLSIFWVAVASAQSYTISTIVGADLPSNVPGKSLSLPAGVPQYLTADSAGDVYLVDQNIVVRLDAGSGLVSLVAGTGASGYSGDNGPAISATLNAPQGLAVDAAGNLYIADAGNHVVRKVSNGTITTIAGTGTKAATCLAGAATTTGLNSPYGLAADSSGNLYISDLNNNCVLELSNDALGIVAADPGNLSLLYHPHNLALDSAGNLYIAVCGDAKVDKVAPGTQALTLVAGGGSGQQFVVNQSPATSASLICPSGVAVDSSGNVYISDQNWNEVFKVSQGIISIAGGSPLGILGFGGDGDSAAEAFFQNPEAVALDAMGNLYIADGGNRRVRKISNGAINSIIGNGLYGDNAPSVDAILLSPSLLALDAADNLYISDPLAVVVREVSAATGIITTVAGTGSPADRGFNPGPAASTPLGYPQGLAVDPAGNLYIADPVLDRIVKLSSGSIAEFAGDGVQGYTAGGGATQAELEGPLGIAVDSRGNVYFSDSTSAAPAGLSLQTSVQVSHIAEVSSGQFKTVAGDGIQGYVGNGGSAQVAEFSSPSGVAVDSAGNIFVSDTQNNAIRKIVPSNDTISTVAGTGAKGFTGEGGPATAAELNLAYFPPTFQAPSPGGVAVDKAGNIFIADTGNNRVRMVSAATGDIATIAGNGTAGFSGDGGPATSAELNHPLGIAVDSSGNVFVVEGTRVRILTPASGSGCAYTLSPDSLQPLPSGGSESVDIQTTAYCTWSVTGLPAWITVPGLASGVGPGSFTLSVAANSGAARSASIAIGGQAITVSQAAVGPTITLVANAEGEVPIVARNTWVEIKGADLAPAGDTRIWAAGDFVNGELPISLDGVSVTIGGAPAYIYYISPTQVNVLTPPGAISGSVPVVLTNGTLNASFNVQAQAESPSFFVFDGGPYIAATDLKGGYIGPAALYPGLSTPAMPGETIVIYANGFGATSVPVVPGAETQSGTLSPLPVITIGGAQATVSYAGSSGAPGEFQFNVIVPSTLAAGDQAIVATYNGLGTQRGTLLTLQ